MRAGTRALSSLRRPERRRRNRRVLALAVLLLLAASALPRLWAPLTGVLGRLPLFQAGRVVVTGLLYLSREEVRAEIPVEEGESLFKIRPEAIVRALEKNPRIENASVSLGPSEVRVRVRERRPFLLLHVGPLVEVDASGIILQPIARGLIADRPVVTGLAVPARSPGTRVKSARFQAVCDLVTQLEAPEIGLLAEISEIVAGDPRWLVLRTSRDQIPILIDPDRTTPRGLKALAVTLRDLRENGRSVLAVDARYSGQVIVRCAPEKLGPEPTERDKV